MTSNFLNLGGGGGGIGENNITPSHLSSSSTSSFPPILHLGSSVIDTEQQIDSAEVIRIAVVPVGHTSPTRFAKYFNLIQELSLIELNTLMPDRLNIADFQSQLWRTGSLRFHFIQKPSHSDWATFQSHKRILGVIGVLDCHECHNINQAARQFTALIQANFPLAMIFRCLAFDPTPDQENLDFECAPFFSLIPNAPTRDATLLFLNEVISFFAYSILKAFRELLFLPQELEKRVGAYLATPLDPCREADDISRLKRRLPPRLLKLRADFALLACAPADALQLYTQAAESLRSLSDHIWIAGALEGLASAALALVRYGAHPTFTAETSPELVAFVTAKQLEALNIYAKRAAPVLEIECRLKLAKYLMLHQDRLKALEHLTAVFELSRSALAPVDALAVCTTLGVLAKHLRFRRKSCFFLREAAHLASSLQDYAAAHQLLIRTACCLHLQDLFQVHQSHLLIAALPPQQQRPSFAPPPLTTRMTANNPRYRSGWIPLQRLILLELIDASKQCRDPHSSVIYLSYTLRHFNPFLSVEAQAVLAQELNALTSDLPPTQWPALNMSGIPLLVGGTPQALKEELQPRPTKPEPPGKKSIFIFSPFENRNKIGPPIVWTVGQSCILNVFLQNPLGIPLEIDMIEPYVEGIPVHTSALSLKIAPSALGLSSTPALSNPQGITELALSITPLQPGQLRILGCIIRTFQIDSIHLFPVDPEIAITVVEELPLLHISVPRPPNSLQLVYPGQFMQLQANLQNLSSLSTHWMQASATSEESETDTHSHLLPPFIHVDLPAVQSLSPPHILDVLITIRCRKSNVKATVFIEYGTDHAEWKRRASYCIRQQIIPGLAVSHIAVRPVSDVALSSFCNLLIHLTNEAAISFEVTARWSHPSCPVPVEKQVVVTSQTRLIILQIPRFSLSPAEMEAIINAQPGRQFVKQTMSEAERLHSRRAFCYKAALMEHLSLEWSERPNRSHGMIVGLDKIQPFSPVMLATLEPCPLLITPSFTTPTESLVPDIFYPFQVGVTNVSSTPITNFSITITPLRVGHPESADPPLSELAWSGTLSRVVKELSPGDSIMHELSICFLIPGRFTIHISVQNVDGIVYYSHSISALNIFPSSFELLTTTTTTSSS